MNVNEQQLQLISQYEGAARHYCAATGEDPDEVFELPPLPSAIIGAPPTERKAFRWQLVAEDLIDLSLKLKAIQKAAQALPGGVLRVRDH